MITVTLINLLKVFNTYVIHNNLVAMKPINYKKIDNELYAPNLEYSISTIMPTSLEAIDCSCQRHSLTSSAYAKILDENNFMNVHNVVIIIIDSLGLNQIMNHKFGKLFENVNGLELSSVFPTVTSAAVSSIMMGLFPYQHGLLGHKIYIPELNDIVDLLKMTTLSDNRFIFEFIEPTDLIWQKAISDLEKDILLVDIAEQSIAGHGLSYAFQNLRHTFGYYGFADGLAMTKYFLKNFKQRKIITLYNGVLDHIAHGYGPFSPEFIDSMDVVLFLLKQFLNRISSEILKDTSFVITADHGQTFLSHKLVIKKRDAERIIPYLNKMPGRSGRVIHFYASEDNMGIVRDWLNETYGANAVILSFDECVANNLISCDSTNCRKIRERLGDLLVILKDNVVSVFERKIEEERLFEREIVGSHGSLSLNELRVPFIAINGYELLKIINNLSI